MTDNAKNDGRKKRKLLRWSSLSLVQSPAELSLSNVRLSVGTEENPLRSQSLNDVSVGSRRSFGRTGKRSSSWKQGAKSFLLRLKKHEEEDKEEKNTLQWKKAKGSHCMNIRRKHIKENKDEQAEQEKHCIRESNIEYDDQDNLDEDKIQVSEEDEERKCVLCSYDSTISEEDDCELSEREDSIFTAIDESESSEKDVLNSSDLDESGFSEKEESDFSDKDDSQSSGKDESGFSEKEESDFSDKDDSQSSDKFESEFSEKEDYEISDREIENDETLEETVSIFEELKEATKEIENKAAVKDEQKLENTEKEIIHPEDEEDIKNTVISQGQQNDFDDVQEEVVQIMKSTAYIVLKKENKSNKRLQMLVWKNLFKCCLGG